MFAVARLFIFCWFLSLPADSASVLCSFGRGRLGNQISSLASLYSLARRHGLRFYVTEEQQRILGFYFQLELPVLERDLPAYQLTLFGRSFSRLAWRRPWHTVDDIDNNFNYSALARRPELHHGLALDAGHYPNEVAAYTAYLPQLRRLLVLRPRFVSRAQAVLAGERARRGLEGQNVTWVGVHVRWTKLSFIDGALILLANLTNALSTN